MKQNNRERAVLCTRWVVDAGLEPSVSEGMQRGGRSLSGPTFKVGFATVKVADKNKCDSPSISLAS